MVGMGSIFEEMGKCSHLPVIFYWSPGAGLIALGGNDKQKQTYLPQIVDGSITTALALEEGNRHSPLSINTEAKKDGENYSVTGDKTFVIDGHSSKLLIVAARTMDLRKIHLE